MQRWNGQEIYKRTEEVYSILIFWSLVRLNLALFPFASSMDIFSSLYPVKKSTAACSRKEGQQSQLDEVRESVAGSGVAEGARELTCVSDAETRVVCGEVESIAKNLPNGFGIVDAQTIT